MNRREAQSLKERLILSYRRIEMIEAVYLLLYDLETRLNETIDKDYAVKLAQPMNEYKSVFTPIFSSLHFQLVVELNSMINEKRYYSLSKLVDDIGDNELATALQNLRTNYQQLLKYISLWRNKLYAHYAYDHPDEGMNGFSYKEMCGLIDEIKKLITRCHENASVDGRKIAYGSEAFKSGEDRTSQFIARLLAGYDASESYNRCLSDEAKFIAARERWSKLVTPEKLENME